MPRAKTDDELNRGEQFAELLLQVMADNKWNQIDLGKRVGATQQAVSDWLSGKVPRDPDKVFNMEQALGLPGGSLSHVLGYVPVEESHVPTAIAADPYLTEEWKRVMQATYRNARNLLDQIKAAKAGDPRTERRRAKATQ